MELAASNTATVVRREVRRILEATPAYLEVAAADQRQVAEDMVRIGGYLAEPEGIRANSLAGTIAAVPASGTANDLLADVNFPAFVGALIHGVFDSIVDSSIEQMSAYSDLLKIVAETLDEFASAATSEEAARDWLAVTYPECFERDATSGKMRLRSGVDCTKALPRLRFLPGQESLRRIKPEQIEKDFVPAVRRRLAASRQRMLATMVLMGINRIVVTDGRIEAR